MTLTARVATNGPTVRPTWYLWEDVRRAGAVPWGGTRTGPTEGGGSAGQDLVAVQVVEAPLGPAYCQPWT